MGVPDQLQSVMVEWSTTYWFKQAPHSFLCLKKVLCTIMCLFLFIFVLLHHFKCHYRVCGTVHSAMFSGCYIHVPYQTNTKPFTCLYVEVTCVSYGAVCVYFLLANSEPPGNWSKSLSSFVQLISYLIQKYCGISFSVAQKAATNEKENETLARRGLCQQ